MPMARISRDEAIVKKLFHERLREWLTSDEDAQIGPEEVDGRTSWVYVRDGSRIFGLHADTKRDAVDRYLQMVALYGDDMAWTIATSQRGKMSTVVYGPERARHRSFYLYVANAADA